MGQFALEGFGFRIYLVAELVHFTLFGILLVILLPPRKLEVYPFLGLMNSAIKFRV